MIFTELDSGKSVENKEIHAYISDSRNDKYLYLLAGTHGDEVEGVYVLKELFTWLKTDHNIKDLPVVVIPILNIDGYCTSSRVNAHQVDLNRNYPTKDWSGDFSEAKYNPGPEALSEPENVFLEKLFEKFPPAFVLSFHSWKPILNFNGDCKDIAEFLAKYNSYPISETIGYPTPGSLGSYVPEKYNAGVLTFECPPLADGKTLKEIWEDNEKGLKLLIESELLSSKIF